MKDQEMSIADFVGKVSVGAGAGFSAAKASQILSEVYLQDASLLEGLAVTGVTVAASVGITLTTLKAYDPVKQKMRQTYEALQVYVSSKIPIERLPMF